MQLILRIFARKGHFEEDRLHEMQFLGLKRRFLEKQLH